MQLRIYSDFYIRTIIVCNKLFKKYLYDDIRFPIGKIHEDEFTTYKVFHACKLHICTTNEVLYFYRYNAASITRKKFNVNSFFLFLLKSEKFLFS